MKTNLLSKKTFFVLATLLMMMSSLLLFTACDPSFENSTTIKQNAANVANDQLQYTSITIKENEDIYLKWTISDTAKDNASSYALIIVDNDNVALTSDNKLKSVTIYDGDQKSLGTATTETEGNYALGAVLGDNKIAAGTYYAVCQFTKAGTYKVCIKMIA